MPQRTARRSKRPTRSAGSDSPGPWQSGRLYAAVIIVSLALGIVARLIAVSVAPQSSYLPDHISNMGWSTYAYQHGPWTIYELPARQPLVARVQDSRTGRVGETVKLNAHACNYPPLSIYLFWLQGAVWHALDSNVVTLQPPPHVAVRFGLQEPVSSRIVDTRASRFADALPALVFDLFLAWGVAALVRTLRPDRRGRLLAAIGFAITILAPPIFLDSAFWNQADAWIACLLVWCLVFLMRERLALAGVIYGAALMTKPQAVLFAPVFIYVFLALRFAPGGTWRRALGLLKTAAVALVVVAVIAAPFTISDARSAANPDGALRWFKRSYLGTIGSEMYQRTTLSAFNLWWLDLLAHGTPQQRGDVQRFLDVETPVLGLSKAVIGKLLLGLAIVLAWVLCARKWRWAVESWPVCTFLILLAAFTLPTSVHERYIYYCIPLAIALAASRPTWIAPLLALLIVGTAEMTSFRWAGLSRIYAPDSAAKGVSILLAILTVLTLLYSYAVLIPKARRAEAGAQSSSGPRRRQPSSPPAARRR